MTEGEVLKLYRYVNGYDNLDQLAEACGIGKRSLSEQNGAYLSNKALRLLADAFDVSLQALILSFRLLQDLDYDNKEDRQKALIHILSISCNNKKK